jgi:hypothetical protein
MFRSENLFDFAAEFRLHFFFQVCTQHGIRPALEPLLAGLLDGRELAVEPILDHLFGKASFF